MLAVDPAGRRDAFPAHDQRHGRLLLVEHHLAGPAVRGQSLAVIAGEDDERVLLLAGLAQRLQHLPDLLVHVLHHAVVGVAYLRHWFSSQFSWRGLAAESLSGRPCVSPKLAGSGGNSAPAGG